MDLLPVLRHAALPLWVAAWAGLAVPGLGAAEASLDPPVQTLARGTFVLSDAMAPPPTTAGSPVTLPDDWEVRRPHTVGSGWYLLEWPAPQRASGIDAVYLTATTMPTEVFVNGQLIGATGALLGPRPRSWQQARLFVVPEEIVKPGNNVIALHVHERVPGAGGLGPVLAGPEPMLRERAFRDLFLYTLGPTIVSVTIIVLGIFIIVLWLRRRDPTYGLFGSAAILWGIHTGLSQLTTPLLPPPHWGIWWTSMYMLFVGLLCLFCLRFAETDWRPYRRAIVGFVVAVPLVLYVSVGLGIVSHAAVAVRLFGIVLVLIALTAVARYALRKRNVESLLLLLAGAVSTAFAIHDWLAAQNGADIRPLMLVPYAGLAFLLLVGWILTDRFVRALNEFELLNANLERRVAEKSEALEEQLKQTRAARDAAETANHAKTRFLAAASHDLRQPLHALGLFAARLGDRTRDPDDAALAHRISTSVSSLDSLFSALLDVSKLEAGVVETRSCAMALNTLFDRLANDFAPEALEKNLKFAVVPTARAVYSDPVLLERILRNLLANALRYTSEGGVVVGARRRGSRIAVEVWDSGPGIAAENLEHVFEEFYQIGNPERAQARGLGLGLAIVRRLARLLGHEVQVTSRLGRGSVFRVLISAVPAGTAVPPPSLPPIELDPLNGRRVLVIEDDEPIREGMRQTLATWNCAPMLAAHADEAIAQYGSEPPPDALLVDFRLPLGRDGLDAIRRLRAIYGRDVPAIVVSGESSSEELARITAAGFMLLHKPVAPAKLRAALSYLLRT